MKGHAVHGPGRSAWEDIPDPGLGEPTDAAIRVDAVTICGTDLHILRGDVPGVRPGTVLGHDAVGEVGETGDDVRTVRPGDRVLVLAPALRELVHMPRLDARLLGSEAAVPSSVTPRPGPCEAPDGPAGDRPAPRGTSQPAVRPHRGPRFCHSASQARSRRRSRTSRTP